MLHLCNFGDRYHNFLIGWAAKGDIVKPIEHHVDKDASDYYIYAPSQVARRTYLYPTLIGRYRYLEGYHLSRSTFDSFNLMMVRRGEFRFATAQGESTARDGDIVLLDCRTDAYQATAVTDSDVIWMHFDGIAARPYYDVIHRRFGTVIGVRRSAYALSRMTMLVDAFAQGRAVSEARMSLTITEILTECMAAADEQDGRPRNEDAIEEVLAYIAAHLGDPLPLSKLSSIALMSEYHFIRMFSRATGTTPHAYIVNARMDAATYMLTNGYASLKEICTECGFTSTSAFCSAFKSRYGCSPMTYRARTAVPR